MVSKNTKYVGRYMFKLCKMHFTILFHHSPVSLFLTLLTKICSVLSMCYNPKYVLNLSVSSSFSLFTCFRYFICELQCETWYMFSGRLLQLTVKFLMKNINLLRFYGHLIALFNSRSNSYLSDMFTATS